MTAHARRTTPRPTAPALACLLLAILAAVPVAPLAPGAARAGEPARDADAREPGHYEGDGNPEAAQEARYFRSIAGGEITAERWQRMWDETRRMPRERPARAATPARAAAPAAAEVVNAWQLVGPIFSTNPGGGLMTGRVRDVDPVNVRVLAASGGLWRFNFLVAVPMADSVPASWFGAFATHPANPNLVLLGTGEYGRNSGTGLYRTTDGGVTWSLVTVPFGPTQYSRIRWSEDGTIAFASTNAGFYRSTDGGLTWSQRFAGTVSDFALVPTQANLVYLAVPNLGIWRSTDGGVTFTQLNAGGAPAGITGLATVSAGWVWGPNQAWVYAAFETRIWRSQDSGATWTEVTPPFTVGVSTYGPVISVCPNDANTVLYGNVPLLRTTNGGATWTSVVTPHLHADYHVFGWDPDGNGVWAGHDGGWSHSTDRGATWSSSSNIMPVSQFYSVEAERNTYGRIIGGTQDNNVLYTPNASAYWIDPAAGSSEGDAFGVAIDPYDPTRMWAVSGIASAPIAFPRKRTTDGGTTWTDVTNGIDPTGSAGWLRTDNAFPARLFTSTDFWVYESSDGGATWAKANGSAFPASVRTLTSSTRVAGGAVLYATLASAVSGQRLRVRDNGTWYERSTGLPPGILTKAVPHPWAAYADEAWVIASAPYQQLWHTTDRGQTWTNVTGDLPPSMVLTDIVPNPRRTGEWYVASMVGCWRTKNGGLNWEHWTNGMPPGAILTELTHVDETTTTGKVYLVAATYGRSVWRREMAGEDAFPVATVTDAFVQEGQSGQATAFFRVSLTHAESQYVTVDWATADSTATVADGDYVASGGTALFVPGNTETYFSVPVSGDTRVEGDQVFKIVLSNPLRAQAGPPARCTIQDDDASAIVCHDLYVTDGAVNAVAVAGNRVYIGGSFSSAGPATGRGVPLDAATGLPLALPKVNGPVLAVAPDGYGGWYVGGLFTHVGGAPRTNVARVLADGSVSDWNPVASGAVKAIAVTGGKVYLGGDFTSIGGVPRAYLAEVQEGSSWPTAWDPGANGSVVALAVSGNTLYAGGTFTQIFGASRTRGGAVDLATRVATPWNALANADVAALVVDGGLVYASGNFTSIGGQPRTYLAALDATSGAATAWNPAPDNYVYAIAAGTAGIYAGGAFANIGGQPRAYLAVLGRASAAAGAWAPAPNGAVTALAVAGGTVYAGGNFSSIGGQARARLAALDATTALAGAWNPAPNDGVSALAVSGGAVFAGGWFTSLGAQPRGSLAAFDAGNGALLPWNPNANGSVLALAVDGGTVYAGGSFTNVGGLARNRIAAVDAVSGAPTSFDGNASSTVRTLLLRGSVLHAGGSFTTMSGQARGRAAAFSTSTGALTSWNPNANGAVYALATDGTYVYAGGAFTAIGGQARSALALLSTTTGAASTTWAPNPDGVVRALLVDGSALYVGGGFTTIAGLARPRLALINLSNASVAGWAPAPNDDVYALAPAGSGQVYAGGAFTQVGGVARSRLAQLRPSTNQVANWAPEPDASVNALAMSGSTVWIGGGFGTLGGLPQANVGCAIPQSAVDVPAGAAPAAFALRVSPNPAAGPVAIEYVLPEAARVRVEVLDVMGRRVGAIAEAWREAGAHREAWDTAGLRPRTGVFFVRVSAGGREAVRRFVVLK